VRPLAPARVTLNRMRAARAREEAGSDPEGVASIFGQLCAALRRGGYERFRGAGRDARLWGVDFSGEGSIDVGGPYRESVTLACADLMSGAVPLFMPCPNRTNSVGLNREKVVVRPGACGPLQLAMFECVGALMAIAISTRFPLALDLPSILWKQVRVCVSVCVAVYVAACRDVCACVSVCLCLSVQVWSCVCVPCYQWSLTFGANLVSCSRNVLLRLVLLRFFSGGAAVPPRSSVDSLELCGAVA
jgi:hypothetical protein